jgi:Zn-dependent protease with chaperone function
MPIAVQNTDRTKAATVLGAIHGQIEPVRTSPRYIAGMSLVAVVMILLPLIYLALIGAVAALLWYHATHSLAVFEHARGRSIKGALAVYFAPLIIGGVVLLFMIKPLFAPRRRDAEPLALDPKQEPLLFAFVKKLCKAVHAPAPCEIRIDNEVNASAALRRGFWSLFGNDLTLTIGLPLAAGLSLRQLAGVLAHEFGHFSQGAGMRLTFIIRSISFWFVRLVYERDSWDQSLEEYASNTEGWLNGLVQLARLCVWLTRGILWVLMWIGNLVSCFMLRQMEFDADRHEARLAGSETFQQTARRLGELSVARQMSMNDLSQFMNEGKLADNLPALVLANVPQITPEIRQAVLEPRETSKTGLFDTHPADRDRIASAALEKTPGIFRLPARPRGGTHPDAALRDAAATRAAAGEPEHFDETGDNLPATVLFRDFAKLSRTATVKFYEEQLERDIRPEELCPVASLVGSQEADLQAFKTLERYFGGAASPLRPLPLPAEPGNVPLDVEEKIQAVSNARERMLRLLEAYRADFKVYDDADTEHLEAIVAKAVYGAKAGAFRKNLELKYDDAAAASKGAKQARQTMEAAAARLGPFETAAGERVSAALQLTLVPDVRERSRLGDDAPEWIARLLKTAHLTATLVPGIVALRNQLRCLSALLACIPEGDNPGEALVAAIRRESAATRECLSGLRERLAGAPYPFDHSQADMTLDWYICNRPPGRELPDSDEIGEIGSLANEAITKLFGLQQRLVSHLTVIAEKIEEGIK